MGEEPVFERLRQLTIHGAERASFIPKKNAGEEAFIRLPSNA
jgi:hypothetical protein